MLLLGYAVSMAQNVDTTDDDETVALDDPSFVPTVKVSKVIDKGDSIPYMEMSNVYVYPKITFDSKQKQNAYLRLVRNVKKVLPIAKEANQIIVETYEYLETLPNKKARDEHLKLVEKSIVRDYKPKMKKLTYSQGKLLIKLVYRECDSSTYDIVKAVLGHHFLLIHGGIVVGIQVERAYEIMFHTRKLDLGWRCRAYLHAPVYLTGVGIDDGNAVTLRNVEA